MNKNLCLNQFINDITSIEFNDEVTIIHAGDIEMMIIQYEKEVSCSVRSIKQKDGFHKYILK